MKIAFCKTVILCFILVFTLAGCGAGNENLNKNDDLYVEKEGRFRLNPKYIPFIFGGTIVVIVGGILTTIVITVKRGKRRRATLVAEINKAYKSGDMLDTDYEDVKKALDPFQYAQLVKAYDFALANKRRYDFLHSKYPKEMALALFDRKHWIGMTVEQLVDSRGHPKKKEDEVLKTKTTRTYIYVTRDGVESFCFVNGVLESADHK